MTSSLRAAIAGALLLLSTPACSTPTEVYALRCDVTVDQIAPQPAVVGESVVLTGTPFTSTYDSAVYVGPERAEVQDVARTNCANCDACRVQQGCTECSDCDACDTICSNECVETVTFAVPDLPPGTHGLQLFNAHGQTPVLDLEVESTGYDLDETDSGDTADTGTSALEPPASTP